MGLTGGPCKHLGAVVQKLKIGTLNIMPIRSPELRSQLFAVATGRSDVPLEWFATLKEDNRCNPMVSDSTGGNHAECSLDAGSVLSEDEDGAVTSAVAGDNVQLRKESLALQNSLHKRFDSRNASGSSTLGSDSSALCGESSEVSVVKEELMSYCSSLVTNLENNPRVYLPAVKPSLKVETNCILILH